MAGTAFISINDGIQGGGPNYLASLDATTGNVTHLGRSVDGLDALAWDADVPFVFGQTIRGSTTPNDFVWTTSLEFDFVRGAFVAPADVGGYLSDLQGAGSGTSLDEGSVPPPGSGAWYLLRPACNAGSWSSGGIGEWHRSQR